MTEAQKENQLENEFLNRFSHKTHKDDMKDFAAHLIAVMEMDIENMQRRISIFKALFTKDN